MSPTIFQRILGPRAAHAGTRTRRRAIVPVALFLLAAAILVASYFQPYWNMTLEAPQYPQGLTVHAYLSHLTGDVTEIDNLNHYIGMRPLEEAAQLERELSALLIGALVLLVLAAIFVHSPWTLLLAIPAVFFPAGFLFDLYLWLSHFGQNLDPTAALSSSIKPFTPPILGVGKVGNFRTVANPDTGLYMACAASGVVLLGLFFQRRAYKPLADLQKRRRRIAAAGASHQSIAAGVMIGALLGAGAHAHAADGFDLHAAIRGADTGAVITVPPGVYPTPVVIDKPLTLVGEPGAVIDAFGQGDCVHILAPGVTLRGFTIRNTGASLAQESTAVLATAPNARIEHNTIENALFGISLKGAPHGVVADNTITGMDLHIASRGDAIRLWSSDNTLVENNTVRNSRDLVVWYSQGVHLIGNRVTDSRYGLHLMYCHDNVLERNHLEGNSVGAFLMYSRGVVARENVFLRNRGPSGYGLGFKDMERFLIENNAIVGNRVGVYLDNPPVQNEHVDEFRGNLIAWNDVGLVLQPSVRRTAVVGNSFIENVQQVGVRGGGQIRESPFHRDGRGNYWSDYRGYDLGADGVGDLPHRVESLWDSLVDREASLRLFLYSPAQQAVEFAAAAFPVVQPRPIVTDEAPLMAPAHARLVVENNNSGTGFAFAGAGLLAISLGAAAFAIPVRARRPGRDTPSSKGDPS